MRRRYLGWIAIGWLAGSAGCAPSEDAAPARPSVLLVVMDTTRMDAVSAYGAVTGTTPYLDSLAAEGLLYRWAMAPAPWTLPSHATLFTSLGPEKHGVGVAGRMALADGHRTLAGQLRSAGYETIGFSENPLVMAGTGLAAGFDHFEGESDAGLLRVRNASLSFDVVLAVQRWLEQRSEEQPFFLFVNLFDPHDPYELSEHSELPPGIEPAEAESLGRGGPFQAVAEFAGICDRIPPRRDLEVLKQLYLGEVRTADEKLGRIHSLLQASGGRLLTVVTADHGEHLGEHRLLGHEFSVRGEVLRVPLVVHGLEDAAPTELEAPVGLADIAPSVARWTGLEAPEVWSGRPLPVAEAQDYARPALRAFYADAPLAAPAGFSIDHSSQTERRRRGCSAGDRVFGQMLTLVRFPFKLIRYAQAAPELYDLRWDERELSDVSGFHPEQVEALGAELDRWGRELDQAATEAVAEPASPETLEALRALGYVE